MKTKKKLIYWVLVLLVVLVGIVVIAFISDGAKEHKGNIDNSKVSMQNNSNYKQTVSDGTLKIPVLSSFELATNEEQISANSYISPCSDNFDYCLYYTGKAYEGTNFESAGISIKSRKDLSTKSACMNTEPDVNVSPKPKIDSKDGYSTSIFSPIGDAAVGHSSDGSLYRLFSNNKCYEVETRIVQSQFMNYPAGTIGKFTTANQNALESELKQAINAISLPNGTKDLF